MYRSRLLYSYVLSLLMLAFVASCMKVTNGPKKSAEPQQNTNTDITIVEDPAPCNLNFSGLKNANAISTSEIVLTWDEAENVNCNAIAYRVYDYSNLQRAIGTSTRTSYTVDNLSSNKEYTFLVQVIGDRYEFTNNVFLSATTLSTNPLCDLTFAGISSATAFSETAAELEWTAATGCDGYAKTYRVYQNGDYYSPVIQTADTKVQISQLTQGTIYSFLVRPVVDNTEYTNHDVTVTFGVQRSTCNDPPSNGWFNNTNNILQTWSGSEWTPTLTPSYSTTASSTTCQYNCNSSYKSYGGGCAETEAPAATTLYLTTASSSKVWLSWIAPGDNANTGTATEYELRYSTSNITESNYSSATIASSTGIPIPQTAGTSQMANVNGLSSGQTYYFAMKTRDAYENWSSISNVISVTTGMGFSGYVGWGHDNWQVPRNSLISSWGITQDSVGNTYVVDYYHHRVTKFYSNGNFAGWIGNGLTGWQMGGISGPGTGDGEFYYPVDVAVDSSNNIYVTDRISYRVQKWTSEGTYVGCIGGGADGWRTGTTPNAVTGDKGFSYIYGIEVGPDDNLYIAGWNNDRISKWTSDGTYVGWIGSGSDGWQTGTASAGTGDKEFTNPADVVVGTDGYMYITDYNNSRIQKWNINGTYIGWIGGGSDGWQTGAAPSSGNGDQFFEDPYGIHIDSNNNLYIVEVDNNRVTKWTSSGTYLGWIGYGKSSWGTGNAPGNNLGYNFGAFQSPRSVYVDSNNNIFVTDPLQNRIQRFNSSGTPTGWLSGISNGWQTGGLAHSEGNEDRYFHSAVGVNYDSNGSIYVSDSNFDRVLKWSSDGTYQGWIGQGSDGWQTGDGAATSGSGDKEINGPRGMNFDSSGNMYISDYVNDRIQKWTTDGTYIGWIGGGSNGWQTGASSTGTGDAIFGAPIDIDMDSEENIYVADYTNHRIMKWNINGTYIGWIGGGSDGWQTGVCPGSGNGDSEFDFPYSVDVDGSGNIYVIDRMNHRVQKWNSNGNFIGWIGGDSDGWKTGAAPATAGTGEREFNYPQNLAVTNDGTIYVADTANSRIAIWGSDGNYIGSIGKGSPGIGMTNGSTERGILNLWITSPTGITVDESGKVYILDDSGRVLRYE